MKYGILSDIHANLEALQSVLAVCEDQGVETYICLGDVVGYNANPKECLDIVRQLPGLSIVKGNHDEYVSKDDDLMEGFNANAKAAIRWTRTQLPPDDLRYLANMPMRQTLKGTNITIVHATLDEPEAWGYIFDTFRAKDNFAYQQTTLCFCGHSHMPMAFCKYPFMMRAEKGEVGEIPEWAGDSASADIAETADYIELEIKNGYRYLVNVGSVGQPRNRDPRASFCIYDSDAARLCRFRIPYDIETAQEKIIKAGLPERNYLRLAIGN